MRCRVATTQGAKRSSVTRAPRRPGRPGSSLTSAGRCGSPHQGRPESAARAAEHVRSRGRQLPSDDHRGGQLPPTYRQLNVQALHKFSVRAGRPSPHWPGSDRSGRSTHAQLPAALGMRSRLERRSAAEVAVGVKTCASTARQRYRPTARRTARRWPRHRRVARIDEAGATAPASSDCATGRTCEVRPP